MMMWIDDYDGCCLLTADYDDDDDEDDDDADDDADD